MGAAASPTVVLARGVAAWRSTRATRRGRDRRGEPRIVGGQSVQARRSRRLRQDGYPVSLVPIDPRFPRGLGWLRRFPYCADVVNQALYLPSLRRLARRRRRARVLRVVLVVPARPGAGDAGRRGAGQARGAPLPQRRGRRSPGALGRSSTRGCSSRTRSSCRRGTCAASSRATATRAGDPQRRGMSRFATASASPLRPRLLSTRNLEPGYGVADTILEAFAASGAAYPDATLTVAGYGSRTRRCAGWRRLGAAGPFGSSDGSSRRRCRRCRRGRHLPERIGGRQPAGLDPRGVCGRAAGRVDADRRHRGMVRDGETGLLVPPRDPAAHGRRSPRCLATPERAVVMARRARQAVDGLHVACGRAITGPRSTERASAMPPPAFRMGPAGDRGPERAGAAQASRRRGLDRAAASRPRGVLGALAPDAGARRRCARGRSAPRARGAPHAALERFLERGAARDSSKARSTRRRPPTCASPAREAAARHRRRGRRDARRALRPARLRGLSFGDPVDWHLDPVAAGERPSCTGAGSIRSTPVVGDSKVIWELNRHQWLVRLAQAYRMTGDERYAERSRRRDRRLACAPIPRASASTGRAASKSRSASSRGAGR